MERPSPARQPLNIILLGDPAAGKATQAMWIAKKYRMFDLDMGRELRRPVNKRKFDFAHSTAEGKLTPTKVVRNILHHMIMGTAKSRGILFDGTPKMVGEARLVAAWLKQAKRSEPIVIYLHIPVAETMRRMSKRGRKDDTRVALLNRIAYYRNDVAHTVAFFKTIYRFKKVSGLGMPKEVAARIEKEIKRFIKK
jgi:adenylate kinase family enzyme